MKKTTRIVSVALAALTVSSTAAVAAVSASAAAVSVPKTVKAANTKDGIKISWKKVKGASKYKVYRRKKLVATTKKTAFTDKKVTNGVEYSYKVKAVGGKASKAVSVTRVKAPTSLKLKTKAAALKLTWKAGAAKKYKVYRKASGKKYALLKTVTKMSCTDKSVKNGVKYSYKVKAVIGKSASVASAAKAKTFMSPIELTAADTRTEGNKTITRLKWIPNKAADSYKVYRVDFPNELVLLDTIESAFYVDTVEKGYPTIYTYIITAVKNGDESYEGKLPNIHIPENCYYTDAEGNLNVDLKLKVGEKYSEGNYLYLTYYGNYPEDETMHPAIEVVEGKDVVEQEYGVIKALAAGKAKIQVTFTEAVREGIYNMLSIAARREFNNTLKTCKVYVNVTVE